MRRFAPLLVRHADDRHFLHRRMPQQHAFDLDRRDVLAAADDDVLEPVADLDVAVRMDDRGVAGVEPAAAHRHRGRLGIVVVALHHDVAAHDDLADRRAVVRHLAPLVVDHAQLAGRDQLDALPRLDHGALGRRQRVVLGPRLADRDERRRLGQAVDLRDRPAELALDALDRRRRRRRAGGHHADAPRRPRARCSAGALAMPISTVGAAQSIVTRSRVDELEDLRRVDLAQADVRAADRGDDPDERPAVGVEHRQRPEVAIRQLHREVQRACRRRSCRRCGG